MAASSTGSSSRERGSRPRPSSRPSSASAARRSARRCRLLAAQGLIRTAKGATGGSYITVPTTGHLSDSLRSGIGLLAATRDVSLDELMEARLLLEVPAARLAARRRERCCDRAASRGHPRQAARARHARAVRPQPGLPRRRLRGGRQHAPRDRRRPRLRRAPDPSRPLEARRTLPPGDQRSSPVDRGRHRARDEDAAGGEMHDHVEYLRPYYEKAWREARRRA